MSFEIELIKKEQQKIATWSGGTTTQLAIYPKEAIYSERNFKWRLSSANVEAEESVFTSLPGFNRILMIIEGKIHLEHEGHHTCVLGQYEQDYFSGDWKTRSYGKVTDFNLIMNNDCLGEVGVLHLKNKEVMTLNISSNKFKEVVFALYCTTGKVKIKIQSMNYLILKGDFLLITSDSDLLNIKLVNKDSKTALIKAIIRY